MVANVQCSQELDRPLPTRGRVLARAAAVYDLVMPIATLGGHRRLSSAVADALQPQPGERILDIGCGTGTLTWEIARRMHDQGDVVGIDAAHTMIRVARSKRASTLCRYELALAEDLPFADGYFDAVTSCLFFHHIDLDLKRKTLNGVLRVLRPGGRVVIADMGPPYSLRGSALSYGAWILFRQPEIRENILGLLPPAMTECGLENVQEESRSSGYVFVYSAHKKE